MKASRNWSWLFWLTAVSVAFIDLSSKAGAGWIVAPGEARSFLGGVCRVYHMVEVNRGAFLALGHQWGSVANIVFAGVSLVVIVVILVIQARPVVRQRVFLSVALGCLLGGAAGNLHDRLRYGGVRDFLQLFLPLGPNSFVPLTAVFNLADTALLVGAALLLLANWFGSVPDAPAGSQPGG